MSNVVTPLYMAIDQAAEYTGLSNKTLREYINSIDPPPYLKVGKKYMLQVAALPKYLERKQEIKGE